MQEPEPCQLCKLLFCIIFYFDLCPLPIDCLKSWTTQVGLSEAKPNISPRAAMLAFDDKAVSNQSTP